MRAMVLEKQNQKLQLKELSVPKPGDGQILVKVTACGLCRTDLHVVDGDLKFPRLPLVPGHQIVGVVDECGDGVSLKIGQRIGLPWLGGSCGDCEFCRTKRENLCDKALYTGYQIPGGFAEYTIANAAYGFPIPDDYPDLQAAPLLCAGLIGFRCYRKVRDCKIIGLYGFGAAAHILTQLCLYEGKTVFAFVRPGDQQAKKFATKMGVHWVGESRENPPEKIDGSIIFAPDGDLVPLALEQSKKGATIVCGGIHMSAIPQFNYELLWGERTLCSIANLTRLDGEEFLSIAPQVPIKTEVTTYPLERVNQALADLRAGNLSGAAVIKI